ncbi:aspartyl protease family protein [Coralloluteibacterium thermophilus]|uniref:Aspartyl protease family protein n=1 Tax=Coralloluteibacterium thermophilum TaxID=2707049 RepID=A0ABV9NLZ3_9GAMM
MSLRLALPICLLSLSKAAVCAAAPSPSTPAPEGHRIPMHLVGKHPRVQVRIDGVDRPLSFVVDTAAGASVVDAALAERLGLLDATPRRMQVQGAGGSTAATHVTALQALSSGDLRWQAQLLAMDLSKVAEGDAPPVEGILGNDLMARFDLRFDLPAGHVLLAPPGSLPRTDCLDNALPQRAAGLQRFAFVPAQLRDGGDRVPVIGVVDTGAAQTVLNPPAARALGVAEDDGRLRRREAGTRGIAEQVIETWLYTLPTLAIGDWQLPPTEVRISALPVFAVLGLADRPAAILGIDALRQRRVDVLANATAVCLGPSDAALPAGGARDAVR